MRLGSGASPERMQKPVSMRSMEKSRLSKKCTRRQCNFWWLCCMSWFHDLAWEGNKTLPVEEEPDMALAKQLGTGELVSVGSCNPILAYLHSNITTMLFTTGLRKRLQTAGAVAISAAPGGKSPTPGGPPTSCFSDDNYSRHDRAAEAYWRTPQSRHGV